MPVVITADQRGSRRAPDRVPEILRPLNAIARRASARRFERTAGDEVQGVLSDAHDVADVLELLIRHGGWSIGVGIGAVEMPLPASARAGRGPAFVHARRAVEAAKNNPARVAVATDESTAPGASTGAERLETVLMLWSGLLSRRTPAGWEVADLVTTGLSRAEIAGRLGISQSAVSQRAATAGVTLSARARTLVVEMVAELVGVATTGGGGSP